MSTVIDKKRARTLTLLIAAAVGFVGFGVGLRQSPETAEYSTFEEAPEDLTAQPARTNAELASNPWRTEHALWSAPEPGERDPVTPRDQGAYREAMAKRASARAFEGAPPTVPHAVGQGSAKECMICHGQGTRIGPAAAPPIPHEPYAICTQCHVPQSAPLPPSTPPSYSELAESSFEGHFAAGDPYRAAVGAPPQQPHTTFMRERCSSCHGAAGIPGLQTSHPERQSCTQCHAPSAFLDGRR